MESVSLRPIGYVKSCYPEKFGVPRQPGLVNDVESKIVIHAEWQPEQALSGLETYSHLWVIFLFHLNNTARYHAKVHPPRLSGESMGVFATRSPHRPNPIGLSLVEIKKIESDGVIFLGGDLVEGTPVLDIKPYLPNIENKQNARGGWSMDHAENEKINVEFTQQALLKLQEWTEKTQNLQLKKSIEEIIQQDPRPTVYKGFESQESPYRNKHAFKLYDGDIHFQFLTAHHAVVIDIII